MTIIVACDGHMFADSCSFMANGPTHFRESLGGDDLPKIMLVPDGCPNYVDREGVEHTPDFMAISGDYRAVGLLSSGLSLFLDVFNLTDFREGTYDVTLLSIPHIGEIEFELTFRCGDKFFAMNYRGYTLNITRLKSAHLSGSGTIAVQTMTQAYFQCKEEVSHRDMELVLNHLLLSGIEPSIGGRITRLKAGKTGFTSYEPHLDEEDRAYLRQSYLDGLYHLTGLPKPEVKEKKAKKSKKKSEA